VPTGNQSRPNVATNVGNTIDSASNELAHQLATLPPVTDLRAGSDDRRRIALAQVRTSIEVTSRSVARVLTSLALASDNRRERRRSLHVQPHAPEPVIAAEPMLAVEITPAEPRNLTDIEFAFLQVEQRQRELRASIDKMQALPPAAQDSMSAKVASAYEAYTKAVSRAQTVAHDASSTPDVSLAQ
jgi:hypothetical protein